MTTKTSNQLSLANIIHCVTIGRVQFILAVDPLNFRYHVLSVEHGNITLLLDTSYKQHALDKFKRTIKMASF